jgi:ketosteroid isomerase-like protein
MAGARPTLTDTVRAFWAAQAAGDAQSARALMCDDVEWTVVGQHAPVARTYFGTGEFFGQLMATLGRTFEPGSAVMDIRGMYEDAAQSTVVTHLRETARTRTGLTFDNEIVTIMTVRDGQIARCREVMDLYEVRRTFGAQPAPEPANAHE